MKGREPNLPVFVSFYTPSYAAVAERLIASLKKWVPEHDIQAVPNIGDWAANVRYKPDFLREMLDKHKRPIVWVDADAEVQRSPFLFREMDADVAACVWQAPERSMVEYLTGTMYLADTPAVRYFLTLWKESRREAGNATDQPAFKLAIERAPGIRFVKLPVEYTFIFDTHRKHFPDAEAVIVHYQESRTQRK